MKADSLPPDPPSRNMAVAAFVIIAAILVGVGSWYYQSEKKEIIHEKYQTLAAIGELKAKQIQQWRKERVAEVERAAKDGLTRKAVSDVLTALGDQKLQKELQECLQEEVTGQDNGAALLFDAKGNLLASNEAAAGPVNPATLKTIREVTGGNRSVVSDFFRAPDGVIHIDLAAPVPDDNGHPQAVLVLRHEARNYLYPLIQAWPTPSRSAETILVQRDGDEVVFLNNLRHRDDTALSLRYPLTATQLPAVQAVLGKQGIFEGRDYRGTEVVSALLPISGSPWFIEAKVDAEEIFAEARYRASLISLIIGLFILLAAGLVALFYRQRQAGILNNLVKTERQKTAAQKSALQLGQQHQIILQTAMDGFVVVDMQGSIREANEAYRKMTGYSEDELLTMRISDLEASESREETGAHIQKVLAEGQDRFESRQRRKDGGFIDVEVSVQLRPEENVMVAFIHDITERKREQSQLVRSERMLRDSQETARIGHYVMDLAAGLWESSPTLDRLFGIGRDFVRDIDGLSSLLHPEDREKTVNYLLRCLENRETFRMDYRIIRPTDGESRWMAGYGDFEYNDSGKSVQFLGCIQDITEQKAAEAKIKRLSVLYAALSECSQAIVHSESSDELLERVCRIVVDQGEMKLAWIGIADASGDVRVQTA
ncbi:MAG: PAS domain S-box protein, partial [Terrimicrobiaceae bacterium]